MCGDVGRPEWLVIRRSSYWFNQFLVLKNQCNDRLFPSRQNVSGQARDDHLSLLSNRCRLPRQPGYDLPASRHQVWTVALLLIARLTCPNYARLPADLQDIRSLTNTGRFGYEFTFL